MHWLYLRHVSCCTVHAWVWYIPGLDPDVDCMHCRTGACTALVHTCMHGGCNYATFHVALLCTHMFLDGPLEHHAYTQTMHTCINMHGHVRRGLSTTVLLFFVFFCLIHYSQYMKSFRLYVAIYGLSTHQTSPTLSKQKYFVVATASATWSVVVCKQPTSWICIMVRSLIGMISSGHWVLYVIILDPPPYCTVYCG